MRRPLHTANNSKIENSRFYFDASEASFVYKSSWKEMELIAMPEDDHGMTQLIRITFTNHL